MVHTEVIGGYAGERRVVPNRILRDGILTSERVNQLGWPAEVFYRRLHSVVDDFGRFYAHPSLIRAACYPLVLNKVSDSDIGKWLTACVNAALVRVYPAQDGKRYLEVLDFRQRERAEKSKFPDPPTDDSQLTVTCQTSARLDVGVVGDVVERSTSSRPNGHDHTPLAREILQFLNDKTGKAYQQVPANLELIVARLKDGASADELRQVVAKKCREWGGDDKMAGFLRPKTLFNRTNFAQYQGELVAAPD